jgi:hypothetical protein
VSLAIAERVQNLSAALHDKAKRSPKFRFYALYGKVFGKDVLAFAHTDRKPTVKQQEWTVRRSRTSNRMGPRDGWTN